MKGIINMLLEKHEVIERLCKIASKVGDSALFNNQVEHDCFCGKNPIINDRNFTFNSKILDFIETAVDTRIASVLEAVKSIHDYHREN